MAADLPKLLNASGCGAEIELDKLPCRNHCDPRQALSDGEDYELLFTVPLAMHKLIEDWSDVKIIGHICPADEGCRLVSRDGNEFDIIAQGWKHLSGE